MSEVETYRDRARAWLASVEPRFGAAARLGLREDEDLALGRAYLRARYEAGFGGIDLPVEVGGQGLSAVHKRAFELEEIALGPPTVYFGISLGMPVPIVTRFASDRAWARERTIAALRGEEIWCQLFSEPAAGSDLAGVRLKAKRHGADWRLSGQKLWTSWAQYSDYGVILARSDPSAPKHKGLTYFWGDMRARGVTVRPIRLANAHHDVCEVFFDDVEVGDHQRLSEVGGGFSVAMATLMIERYLSRTAPGSGRRSISFCRLRGRPGSPAGRPSRTAASGR